MLEHKLILVIYYYNEEGAAKDLKEAARLSEATRLYTLAAKQGYAIAQK